MQKQLGLLSSVAVLSLSLTSCQELQPQNTSLGAETPRYSDPAMYLSNAEILENYSNVSCESLRDLVDYLDQIGSTDYFRGLSGVIKYQPQACRNDQGSWDNLNDFESEDAIEVPGKLYLTKLDVPTRAFDTGFPRLDGSKVQTLEGEDLHEYFSIEFRTSLKLGAVNESGWYEFAMLSDDGARMTLEDTGEQYINHPAKTPTKMLCGNRAIYLEQGESLPINIQYFQGPRRHIALSLMWRKAASEEDGGLDSSCGKSGNALFFNSNVMPSEPQAEYEGLLDRGWEVVPAHVFRIPRDEYMNPCESDHIQDVINNASSGTVDTDQGV